MTSSRLTRRHVLSAAVVTLLGTATGCGTTNDPSEAATSTDPGFPVTVDSALGTAEIPDRPQRLVTLGQGSAETAVALGNTPVGVERYQWGADETGHLPWLRAAIEQRGEQLPALITGGDDLDIERILELEPDVILAPWSGITQDQFDLLNDIAPTVAYPKLAWSTNWDQQIAIIGKALGKPREAQELFDGIERRFAQVRQSRPHYADHTFSYIYTDGPGTLGVFLPDEQRVATLSKLGLTVDPVVATFSETEGTESALIGLERADQLRGSDLVFTFYMDNRTRNEIEAQPLYRSIPAVHRGSIVASDNNSFVTASSMINPLTVPWMIDRYVPMIDEAIKRR